MASERDERGRFCLAREALYLLHCPKVGKLQMI